MVALSPVVRPFSSYARLSCARLVPAVSLLLLLMQASAFGATPREVWRQFRENHPYHVQTIAVSDTSDDGSRTVIIAEPPPHVTLDELRTRFGGVLDRLTVGTVKMGYDGWLKDVYGVLRPMDDGSFQTTVEDLSRYLFGTSYKAYVQNVASRRTEQISDSLDLNVSSAELRDWFRLTTSEPSLTSDAGPSQASTASLIVWALSALAFTIFLRQRRLRFLSLTAVCFVGGFTLRSPVTIDVPAPPAAGETDALLPIHGGTPGHLQDLLASNRTGVFLSAEPGLIVLIVTRAAPLNDSAIALREFVIDSDLILGGVASGDRVAVIGRERQVDVGVLPPLRVETILQLASATTAELAQSYERTRLFAGKFDGRRDWAPIYLSDELHDTEYGSLLNLTDQLLKSWSQHGEVEYINFNYAKPRSFPFPVALSEHVQTGRVTFNWNTKGVGYNDSRDGFDVLAFTRTGALPVDYLGSVDDRLTEAEDIGAEYFATQNDPNLVRVVQYAGLYQIWRRFSVSASWSSSSRVRKGDEALESPASAAIEIVTRFDDGAIDALMKELDISADSAEASHVREFRLVREELTEYLQQNGDTGLRYLIDGLVRPRTFGGRPLSELELNGAELAHKLSESPFVGLLTSPFTATAMEVYAEAEGRGEPQSWVKTPSIVVSWSTGKNAAMTVGGHSLHSRVSHFTPEAGLPPGKVRVVQNGREVTVHYSPADEAKMSHTVRTVARRQNASAADLTQLVEQRLSATVVPPRPRAVALKLGSSPSRDIAAQRGWVESAAYRPTSVATWKAGGETPPAHVFAMNQISDGRALPLIVERQQNRFLISRQGSNVVEAPDAASAVDALVGVARATDSRPLHVHFIGMEPQQAQRFVQSVELHAPRPRDLRLRTSVDQPGGRGPLVVAELRKGRWNWSEVEIRPAESGIIGSRRAAIDVDVIARGQAAGRLPMRIRVTFERAVEISARTWQRIVTVIEDWLRALSLSPEDIDVMLATRRLMEDLKAIDPLIRHVETRVGSEAGEIIVVEHHEKPERALATE